MAITWFKKIVYFSEIWRVHLENPVQKENE